MILSLHRCGMANAVYCLSFLGLLATLSPAQDQPPKSGQQLFPSPAGTYKYRIKTDIAELATNEKGDLAPEYPAIKKRMDRLIEDASRFDLTKARAIGEYTKYMGKELRLPKGKQIGIEIKTDSGKELFVGRLRIGKSGEYELVPSNNRK